MASLSKKGPNRLSRQATWVLPIPSPSEQIQHQQFTALWNVYSAEFNLIASRKDNSLNFTAAPLTDIEIWPLLVHSLSLSCINYVKHFC